MKCHRWWAIDDDVINDLDIKEEDPSINEAQPIRDHPFKTSANFYTFLTPTPLPDYISDSPKAPPPHHDIGSPDPGYTEMGK